MNKLMLISIIAGFVAMACFFKLKSRPDTPSKFEVTRIVHMLSTNETVQVLDKRPILDAYANVIGWYYLIRKHDGQAIYVREFELY